MAALAYFLNHNWKLLQASKIHRMAYTSLLHIFILQIVLTLPTVLFVSYWWFMPESIRWLISKGKYDKAKEQVRSSHLCIRTVLPICVSVYQ